MSEALLREQLQVLNDQAERATEKAAAARAELAQVGGLLTALGVPMTTEPASEGRTVGLGASMLASQPRRLTLTERIVHAFKVLEEEQSSAEPDAAP